MADLGSSLLGHAQIWSRLTQQGAQNQLPSCLLFTGPSGIGKKKLALALAQAALCETQAPLSPAWQACGHCGSCLRISQAQSESVLVLTPETQQIKVDEARALIEFFDLHKVGRFRFVVVDEADRLNRQASNSLLKTLEEPPADSFIFLISSYPWKLLPTIRSRAVFINFAPDG